MEPQEKFVIDFYNQKRNGFFVDIGANNGVIINNTINLENQYNWDGICIEPHPEAFKALIKNRRVACVNAGLSSNEKEMEFWSISGYSEMLSGFVDLYDHRHKQRVLQEIKQYNQVVDKIKIKSFPLWSILDAFSITRVDYISIDTEGAELDILHGIDYEKTDIGLISLEDNFNEGFCDLFLQSRGFKFIQRIGLDNFYAKT